MSKLGPDSPLYNSRIIDTFIKLIKSRYKYVNINKVLDYAEMKPYQVADQGHWFTQKQVDMFYEKLVKETNNENIAREAGRFAASPESLGVIRQYVLGLISPTLVYEVIKKATSNFTKSSTLETRKLASNKMEIIVTPLEGVNEKHYQCENRKGYFESVGLFFDQSIAKIEHPECIFDGGKCCRYIVSWEQNILFYLYYSFPLTCLRTIVPPSY